MTPEEMRQQQLSTLRDSMAITDDAEWNAISPKLTKVMDARQSVQSLADGRSRRSRWSRRVAAAVAMAVVVVAAAGLLAVAMAAEEAVVVAVVAAAACLPRRRK